jgi:hypothetical protein
MKQKLALVAALLTRRRLLLLDEPTTGVDPGLAPRVLAAPQRAPPRGAHDRRLDAVHGRGRVRHTDRLPRRGPAPAVGTQRRDPRRLPAPASRGASVRSHRRAGPARRSPRRWTTSLCSARGCTCAARGNRPPCSSRRCGGARRPRARRRRPPVSASLEDVFVLRAATPRRPVSRPPSLTPLPSEVFLRADALVRRFGSFVAVDHVDLDMPRGRSSASSARTARASPRRSGCSPGCSRPRPARSPASAAST